MTEFLAAYGSAAVAAVEKSRQMGELAPGNPITEGTVRYWSNAVSIINWLIQKVPQRQRAVAVFRAALAAESEGNPT